ncbi:MAG TPA: ABA4-like family protein [Vicinamibacterales bacterium]|jgi:hypothetical protein
MTPAQVFSIVNPLALVGWLALIFFPRRRWAVHSVAGLAMPAIFAAVYLAILLTQWASSSGSFSSLAGVAALFANPWLLLAGWIHYLAFDLLVGRWEVMDAHERGVPHLAVVPCLLLTFMFGPVGWLSYSAVRRAFGTAPVVAEI